MKQKTKDLKSTLKSWADVDDALQIIADNEISIKSVEAKMNAEIQKTQIKYQPDLDQRNADVLHEAHNIELFCNDHKSDFDEKRTKLLNFGKVMFRLGTPKLKTLKGFTWDAVMNLVKTSRKLSAEYLRRTVALDKQSILKADMKPAQLNKMGCEIVQEETFAYEAFIKESEAVA